MTESLTEKRLSPFRALLARDGWTALGASVATGSVILGAFLLARASNLSPPGAIRATLAVATVWVSLAAPALATGGKNTLSALLRGGVVIDSTGLVLLWVWAFLGVEGGLTLLGVLKIYCVLASVGLAGVAAVCLPVGPRGRCAAAMAVGAGMILLLASLWVVGSRLGVAGKDQSDLATWTVRVNPFCAVSSAASDGGRPFIWWEHRAMYDTSRVGEYVSPRPVGWWQTALLYLSSAVGFALAGWIRRRFIRPADRSASVQIDGRPGLDG